MASLPVWSVVKNSYGYAGNRWKEFAPPVALVFLVNILSGKDCFIALGMPEDAAWIISWVISILTYASLMVGIQRLVLLRAARRGIALLRWDRNFLRYLAISFLYFSSWAVPLVTTLRSQAMTRDPGLHPALQVSLFFLSLIFLVAAMILPIRLSLALPASAIGAPYPFSRSWYATRGNWFRLCAVWFLTLLPFFIIECIVWTYRLKMMMTGTGDGAPIFADWFILPALGTALGVIYLPVNAVMQSLCYDILIRDGGGSGDDTPSAISI
jgi:hypothetical protein